MKSGQNRIKRISVSWLLILSLHLIILMLVQPVAAQMDNSYQILEAKIDSLFQKTMYDQRIPGAGIIILKDGKILMKKGYGFTRLGEEINYVNSDSTIFRVGSITKSFTALALLQQIDRNKINLEDDVNTYLSSLQVLKNFKKPITPYHLLTHSAGFDELGGRRVFNENEQITLADFLKTNLRRVREPGEITAYSTYGIALSGLLVQDLSNMELEEYLKTNIWEPLGMKMTSIDLPEEHGVITSLGYEMYNNINIPQPWEWYHTFPASSINSTVTDMGKYMQMLLNLGTLQDNSILSRDLTKRMLTKQLSIHPDADGFTFGLYERKWNGISSINHGGEMLGFSSIMTLIPEENIGIFVVHHHEGTNLRYLAIETVLKQLLETKSHTVRNKKLESNLSPFTGKYVWLSNCQTCSESNNQEKWEITSNNNNMLSGFNRIFYQVAPLLFKSTDGQRTMSFKKDKDGKVKYMSLGNINVFEKIE